MKKYIILALLCITLLFVVTACNQDSDKQNENFTIATASLSDYSIEGNTVVFDTQIVLINNTHEDKYINIKGDFKTEYKHGLVDSRVLNGSDKETDYEIFLIPADAEILFEVSFSGKKGEANTKFDRNPPEFIIEEIDEAQVNLSEVATNFATASDGTIIIPNTGYLR